MIKFDAVDVSESVSVAMKKSYVSFDAHCR